MPQVVCDDGGVRDLQGLGRQDDIRIQRRARRNPSESRIRPETGRSSQNRGGQGQVGQEAAEPIQVLKAPRRGSPAAESQMEKTPPRLVVGDLGQADQMVGSRRLLEPMNERPILLAKRITETRK